MSANKNPFTDRAKGVLQRAGDEARRLRHEYVGTEHILLGLVDDDGGVAAKVLANLRVDLSELRRAIEQGVKEGTAEAGGGSRLPYTSRAKKAVEFAMTEAGELHHDHVGTEHLLLGLLTGGERHCGAGANGRWGHTCSRPE